MPTDQEHRNIATTQAYLAATDAFDPDAAALHLAPDVIQTEFPSITAPAGTQSRHDSIVTGVREAGYFLHAQRTEVTSILARGDDVAIEAVWTGVLKGAMGPLKAGDTLRIYTASCFAFRDGKIAVQRTYNCIEAPDAW